MICVSNMATEGYLFSLHSLTLFGRALPLVPVLSRTQDLFKCKKHVTPSIRCKAREIVTRKM